MRPTATHDRRARRDESAPATVRCEETHSIAGLRPPRPEREPERGASAPRNANGIISRSKYCKLSYHVCPQSPVLRLCMRNRVLILPYSCKNTVLAGPCKQDRPPYTTRTGSPSVQQDLQLYCRNTRSDIGTSEARRACTRHDTHAHDQGGRGRSLVQAHKSV